MKPILLLVILLTSVVAPAQNMKSLRCPTPKREKTYVPHRPSYLEVSAGAMQPLMYRNDAGALGGNYRFVSRPGIYLAVTEHLGISEKFDILAGIEIAESIQGLRYKINDGNAGFSESNYNGSVLLRFSAGGSYKINSKWNVSVAPFVVLNSYWSNNRTGSSSMSGSGNVSYQQLWEEQPFKDKWHMGLSISSQVKFTERFAGTLLWSIDFDNSVATYGRTANQTGRIPGAALEPYLMYAGIALNYVIWQQGRGE